MAHRDLSRSIAIERKILTLDVTVNAVLGLAAEHWTDAQRIEQMLAHPILMNRPIVITPWGVKLCRPSELVLDILPLPRKRMPPLRRRLSGSAG
jgi:arsenate reductase